MKTGTRSYQDTVDARMRRDPEFARAVELKGGDGVKCNCKRCGYQWDSMSDVDKPKVCPACKSYRWDRERVKGGRRAK